MTEGDRCVIVTVVEGHGDVKALPVLLRFLASISALTGNRSVRADASWVDPSDDVRDAKGAMAHRMLESYKETLHQPKFSSLIDVEMAASKSRSFRRLVEVVDAFTR